MITDSYLRQRGNEQKLMKVCIVAEGCYPYVVGGVSGWINSLIRSFPNIEFILLAIVADRSCRGKFVYELPENLTQVYEVYLDDCEWESGGRKRRSLRKSHLSHKEYEELLNMVLKYVPQESTGLIQHKAFFQIGNLLTIR